MKIGQVALPLMLGLFATTLASADNKRSMLSPFMDAKISCPALGGNTINFAYTNKMSDGLQRVTVEFLYHGDVVDSLLAHFVGSDGKLSEIALRRGTVMDATGLLFFNKLTRMGASLRSDVCQLPAPKRLHALDIWVEKARSEYFQH